MPLCYSHLLAWIELLFQKGSESILSVTARGVIVVAKF
jgi:hypothetical protein